MGRTPLVEGLIDEGERLLDALRREPLPMRLAFWNYSDESDEWRLIVASDLVKAEGPRAAYGVIQSALGGLGGLSISLSDVSVIASDLPMVRALEEFLARHPAPLPTRIRRTVMGDSYIEDMYLYPKRAVQPEPAPA